MLQIDETKLSRSWLDETLLRFERGNDALVLQTRSLLNRVVADTALHARFLNTLSMLEHLGSHKIMATQHGAGIDQATLRHVAEEAQHAFFMKRHAEKEAARPLEYMAAELLAPASARMYFKRLEAGMLRLLERQRSARAAYLYMSMIVEFRALWLYRLYEQTLKRAGHSLTLKRVLGEEQSHLKDMAHRLEMHGELSDTRVGAFLEREHALYERLLGALLGAASAAM